jgi:Bacterial Ig domain/FlgD Ig-like domain
MIGLRLTPVLVSVSPSHHWPPGSIHCLEPTRPDEEIIMRRFAQPHIFTTSTTILLLILASVSHVGAQVCGDLNWEPTEYCGQDAYQVTGTVEMNHDCICDILDVGLFTEIFFGPYHPSADINGDLIVNLSDISYLGTSIGSPVTPCTPIPTIDGCAGNLSLTLDASQVISRGRAESLPHIFSVFIRAENMTNAAALEYALEFSSNLTLINQTHLLGWANAGGQTSGGRTLYIWGTNGTYATGPMNMVELQFAMFSDLNPAWIKLVDFPAMPSSGIQWATQSLDQRNNFELTRNVGINGPDPASVAICPVVHQSPSVTITNPSGNTTASGCVSTFAVEGTATDSDGTIALVEYRVNSGSWFPATGTSSWSINLSLIEGDNWLQVRAVDNQGAYSPTEAVSIIWHEAGNDFDLIITDWSAPTQVTAGCSEISMAATCANTSDCFSSGSFRVGFYLSADPTITPTDQLLTSVGVFDIAAGADTTMEQTLTLSDSGLRGALYLGVFVDDLYELSEDFENNNGASSSFDFPVPAITSIEDVHHDQGRYVRVNLMASERDAPGSATPILQYEFFRRIDALPSAMLANPLALHPAPSYAKNRLSLGEKLAGWEYVGAMPAHGEGEYNLVVPTLADSTVQGIFHSVFFVRAATADPYTFFDSCADSGWSVDNLPPSVPKGLLVAYNGTSGNQLTWEPAVDQDFRYFRIYKGDHPEFVVDPGNPAFSTVETQWVAPLQDGWKTFYKISAVDLAGNESRAVEPALLTGVTENSDLPTRFQLDQNVPNPFNPVTTITFALPRSQYVRLDVYNLLGSRIKSLFDGVKPAGTHHLTWNGRDNSDRGVAAGTYFYRIQTEEFTETRVMSFVK